MQTRNIGKNGTVVSAVGLGCMGMSDFYGPTDENKNIATIQAALNAGVNTSTSHPSDLTEIEEAIPADAFAGTRYGAGQTNWLDSERTPA